VLNKAEATASLIDLAAGEIVATLPTGAGPHEVALHPAGRWAVVADYGVRAPGSTLSVLDLEAPRRARRIDLGAPIRPHGLTFEPDGVALWVTAETRRELWRVSFADGSVLARIPTAGPASHMVARAPDGRLFVSDLGAGTVLPIEPDGAAGRPVATGEGAEGIAVSADGQQLWVTNRASDTVSVLDPTSLEVRRELSCPGFPIRVALTPDGRTALVSCARAGEVALFRAVDGRPLGRIRLDLTAVDDGGGRLFGGRFGASPVPIGLAVAADGRRAWVACSGADAVAELDPAGLRVTRILPAGREPDGIAWLR
ncbi:MAG: YncE family protein, partial [Planctomycetota bacterium]